MGKKCPKALCVRRVPHWSQENFHCYSLELQEKGVVLQAPEMPSGHLSPSLWAVFSISLVAVISLTIATSLALIYSQLLSLHFPDLSALLSAPDYNKFG